MASNKTFYITLLFIALLSACDYDTPLVEFNPMTTDFRVLDTTKNFIKNIGVYKDDELIATNFYSHHKGDSIFFEINLKEFFQLDSSILKESIKVTFTSGNISNEGAYMGFLKEFDRGIDSTYSIMCR